jgi:hypothetical protein
MFRRGAFERWRRMQDSARHMAVIEAETTHTRRPRPIERSRPWLERPPEQAFDRGLRVLAFPCPPHVL